MSAAPNGPLPTLWPSQAPRRPEVPQQLPSSTSSLQNCNPRLGDLGYSNAAFEPPAGANSLFNTGLPTMDNYCCTAETLLSDAGLVHLPLQVYNPEPSHMVDLEFQNNASFPDIVQPTESLSNWQFRIPTMYSYQPFPAMNTTSDTGGRQQYLDQAGSGLIDDHWSADTHMSWFQSRPRATSAGAVGQICNL